MGLRAGVSIERALGVDAGTYSPEQTFMLVADLGIFGTRATTVEHAAARARARSTCARRPASRSQS